MIQLFGWPPHLRFFFFFLFFPFFFFVLKNKSSMKHKILNPIFSLFPGYLSNHRKASMIISNPLKDLEKGQLLNRPGGRVSHFYQLQCPVQLITHNWSILEWHPQLSQQILQRFPYQGEEAEVWIIFKNPIQQNLISSIYFKIKCLQMKIFYHKMNFTCMYSPNETKRDTTKCTSVSEWSTN